MASTQATPVRAPLTGWLQKSKTESGKSRFLKSSNKRFFTLDFDGQIFYYAHSEGKKNLSMPTPFRHILSVEPLAAPGMPEALTQKPAATGHCSSRASPAAVGLHGLPFSSQAVLRNLPSFSGYGKRVAEQHGFSVKLRGKSMQLLCNSKAEVDVWIGGIREAMAMAQIAGKVVASTRPPVFAEDDSHSEVSTTPGTSQVTTPRSSSQEGGDSPYLAPGGTRREFPPMAPGTPPRDLELPTSPVGIGGDIACRSPEKMTPPLAPGVSLRATAATH